LVLRLEWCIGVYFYKAADEGARGAGGGLPHSAELGRALSADAQLIASPHDLFLHACMMYIAHCGTAHSTLEHDQGFTFKGVFSEGAAACLASFDGASGFSV